MKPVASSQIILQAAVLLVITTPWQARGATEAINSEAMEAVCKGARAIKKIPSWAQSVAMKEAKGIERLKDAIFKLRYTYEINAVSNTTPGCENPDEIIEKAEEGLNTVEAEMERLTNMSNQLNAKAGRSAGRLDEFVLAFVQPVAAGSKACVSKGTSSFSPLPAQTDMASCFATGAAGQLKAGGFREEAVVDLEMAAEDKFDPNTDVAAFGYSALQAKLKGTATSGCALLVTHTSSGVLGSTAATNEIVWGGGLLRIGPSFTGTISDNSHGGDDPQAGATLAWTANPTAKVPHLKDTLEAFSNFKDLATRITKTAGKWEEKIQRCLPNPEESEKLSGREQFMRHHQSLLTQNEKRARDLEAAKLTLERYKKEKGELKTLSDVAPRPGENGISSTAVDELHPTFNHLFAALIFLL